MSSKAVGPMDEWRLLMRLLATAAVGWTVAVAVALFWSIQSEREETLERAKREARIHFNKDQAFRFWGTSHGGVYVPADDRTPPNPLLSHVAERDVTTPSGRRLTLMNPAYMVRQMMNEYAEYYGVRGRITSLKPLRPGNAPDDWERRALLAFEQGVPEVFELGDIDGKPFMRLMRPMITQKGCLKCHEAQGYKLGDVRGGVGVSLPMASYLESQADHLRSLAVSHGIIWLLGLAGIGGAGRWGRSQIRDRSRDRETLAATEMRKAAILDSALDGIVTIEETGRVVEFNPSAEKMFGIRREDAIGRDLADLIVPKPLREGHRAGLRRYVQNGDSQILGRRLELAALRADGSEFPIELTVVAIPSGQGIFFTAFLRDITERRRAEKNLKRTIDELARSVSVLERFAHVASHEMLQPVVTIEGFARLLSDRYVGRIDAEADECITAVADGARRIHEMINDLRAYTQIGTVDRPFTEIDGDALVAVVLRDLRSMVDETGSRIETGRLPTLRGDRHQMFTVFKHLIANAIKFRHHGKGAVVRITAREDEAEWTFSVADEGIGMRPDQAKEVFMVFKRLHSHHEYPGTGIGLAICRGIVERHGGRIWIRSQPGEGTEVLFTIRRNAETPAG